MYNFRKFFYSIFLLLFSLNLLGQIIIFEEDFDHVGGPTAGGAGTYKFPDGWLLRNVDNRTPAPSTAYVNEGWERREDFKFNVADSIAFGNSWYNPPGQADDWMWTPEINIPEAGDIKLRWYGVSYDPTYKEKYEIRVMKLPNTPTGGTGVLGNQVSASDLIHTVELENEYWNLREVSLNAYRGETIRIAFRNVSNDKFILGIDDIQVVKMINNDLAIVSTRKYEYTMIPSSQVNSIPLGASAKNNTSAAVPNVYVEAAIYDSSDQLVETINSNTVASLGVGQTENFTFPDWVYNTPGEYEIRYTVKSNTATDDDMSNNVMSSYITISENQYARDNGIFQGTISIGSGIGGYLGQSFTIENETYATSGTITFVSPILDGQYQLVLWNTDGTGKPNSIIAETEIRTFTSSETFTDTLPFLNGPIFLTPGKYVLTAKEFEHTLKIQLTSQIFTLGTTWINYPGNPFGNWANNESFGGQFSYSYAIRLNLEDQYQTDSNNILYVDKNVSGGNGSGNSWENAIPELADALKWAHNKKSLWTEENPLQIWVADGTYYPMYSPADDNFGNPSGRTDAFNLVKNVKLYGGFEGTETSIDQRNWNAHPTILSGNPQMDDNPVNNSFNVIVAAGDLGVAVVDGFTIQEGYTAAEDDFQGLNVNGIFVQNRLGGGINATSTELVVKNSIFRNNVGYAGTAICNPIGKITVINSLFYENEIINDSYGTVLSGLDINVINSTISKNYGTYTIYGYDSINIQNSIIHGNINQSNTFTNFEVLSHQSSIIEGLPDTQDIDPLFTDFDNNDFSLQACSPAVDLGNNSFFSNLTANTIDINGNSRVYNFASGGIIDAGAFEYQGIQLDISGAEFEDVTVTYDGDSHSISVENLPADLMVSYEITDEDNQTTSGNSATNAGIYTITATISGCGPDQQLTAILTIDKATAVITADATQTHTFDGTVKNVVASLNHAESSLTYSPQQGYTNVGTYTITVSAAESQNYLAATKTVSLVINNASFSGIEFNDGTFTYDGTAKSIFVTGAPGAATVTYTNNGQTNAGTYTVTALVQMANYADLQLSATLTINKATAVITADATQTHTFDGTVKNVVASLNHAESSLTYSPQQGYTNVGTYTITVSAAESQNYLAATKTVSLVINNATFSGIEFNNDTFTYDGTAKSIFVTGAPGAATVTYTNNGQTNAGTYTVTALIQMDNYADLQLSATLTINKASAVITAEDVQVHTYDGTIKNVVASLNHTESALTYIPAQGYSHIGTFEITVNAAESQNYLAASKTVTLIIEEATLGGVEFNDGTFTYDSTPKSIFVSGAPTGAIVTYTNNGQINAGTYTVTALVQLENYADVELQATLVINKATAIITAEDVQTHTYDGTVKNVEATLNHDETNLTYSPQQGYTEIGTYEITINAAETQNYLADTKTVTLIIEKEMGVVEVEHNFNVSLVPNPVYNGKSVQVHVDLPASELTQMKIRIYSMVGELIQEVSSQQAVTEIYIPNSITSGAYIIQVDAGKHKKNLKLLVK